MKRFLTSVALGIVLTGIVLAWLALREGIFDSPEALDEQAAGLDGGALEQWRVVDGGIEDPGLKDAGAEDARTAGAGQADERAAKGPSLGLGGVARLADSRY